MLHREPDIVQEVRHLLRERPPDWPARPWALSAPESFLLLARPAWKRCHPRAEIGPRWRAGKDHEALRLWRPARPYELALLELVARDCLRAVAVTRPARRGRAAGRHFLLAPAPAAGRPAAAGPLVAARRLYDRARTVPLADGTPAAPLWQVVSAAHCAYARLGLVSDNALDAFTRREVAPALGAGGLLTEEPYRRWGVVPATRGVLTARGREAQADLESLLALRLDAFPEWARTDPARALAFVGWAGAAMLLIDRPQALVLLHNQVGAVPAGSLSACGQGDSRSTPALSLARLAGLGACGLAAALERAVDGLDSDG